jgi:hypothetical protein
MTTADDHFDELAHTLTADLHVTHSTMMGLPCLRWDGKFFACVDRRSGDLLCKLAETRVNELIASGQARPFAPAGRRFKEWAAIDVARRHLWADYLAEAQAYAVRQAPGRSRDPRPDVAPVPKPRPRRTRR